jgi:hypothetical protein
VVQPRRRNAAARRKVTRPLEVHPAGVSAEAATPETVELISAASTVVAAPSRTETAGGEFGGGEKRG